MSKVNFDIIIGVDQTGATTGQGVPKSLTCSLIDNRNPRSIKNNFELKIKSLTEPEVYALIQAQTKLDLKSIKKLKVLIIVDAVLGLPQVCKKKIQQIIALAKDYEFENKAFGSKTAYQFFNSFKSEFEKPERTVEIITKANSVFNLHPFQKNIGCGTYRILKDLSQDTKWYRIWPHQSINQKNRVMIAEGYPSYYWKHWLKNSHRQLKWKNHTFSNQDSADSFILAYAGLMFTQKKDFINIKIPAKIKNEGWILGVPWKI